MTGKKNPYVGPRAFRPDETLYGRDDESRALLDLLIAERIVLLYSPSGAGKTSLIQAKVIAQMRAEDYQVLPIVRPGADVDTLERPDLGNPFVARVIATCEDGKPDGEPPLANVPGITLASYLSQRSWIRGDARLKLLIFDQFEEVLTSSQLDKDKADFFAQLGDALRNQEIWALFAMREEYSAELDSYRHLLPTRLASHFRLQLLGPEAAEKAIRNPAESVGVRFDEQAVGQLVRELATVRERSGDDVVIERRLPIIEPFYLQIVCHQLWERKVLPETRLITSADLNRDAAGQVDGGGIGAQTAERHGRTGGIVEQALEEYYATVVREVAADGGVAERRIREWLGRELVTSRGLRRQVARGQHETAGLANELVEALARRLLLRNDSRSGTQWYEVAHDRLVEMILAGNDGWFVQHLAPFQLRAVHWDLLRHHGATNLAKNELLKGYDLREAEEWRRLHPEADASAVDEEFLRDSADAWAVGRWKRQLQVGVVTLMMLLVGAGSWWVLREAELNKKLTTQGAWVRASALLSASASEKWRGHDHELASLLAIQAYRLTAGQKQEGGLAYQEEERLRGALQTRPFAFGATVIAPEAANGVGENGVALWLSSQPGVVAVRTGPRSLVLRSFSGGPRDLRSIALADHLVGAAFENDNRRLAVLTRSHLEVHALASGSGSAGHSKPLFVPLSSAPRGPFCLSGDGAVAAIVVGSGDVVEVGSLNPGMSTAIAPLSASTFPAGTVITALACDGKGDLLAWGSARGDVGLVSLANSRSLWVSHNRFEDWPGSLKSTLKDRYSVMDLAVSAVHYLPKSQRLLAIYRQGPPRLYDLRANGRMADARYLLPNRRSAIALEIAQDRGRATRNIVSLPRYLSADASTDERWVAVGGARGEIGLWDLDSLTTEVDQECKQGGLRACTSRVYTADYKEIAGLDGNVGAIRWALPSMPPTGDAAASSNGADGRWLIAANARGNLRWWSLGGLQGVGYESHRTWDAQPAVVYAIAFLASTRDDSDGGALRLAFGGTLNAGVLRVVPRDLSVTKDPSLQIPPRIRSLATDGERRRLVIATGKVDSEKWAQPQPQYSWLLDLSEGAGGKAVPLPGDVHKDGQWAALANAQGNLLLTAGFDGAAIIWRQSEHGVWEAESLVDASPEDRRSAILSAALGSDDRELVLGTFGGKVRRWRDEGGRFVEQELLLDARDPIRALAYSPDGKRLVAGDENGLLQVWSITGGKYKPKSLVPAHKGTIYAASFGADGRLLTGGSDGRVYLWSEVGGSFDRQHRLGLEGPRGEVVSVAFAPTGDLVAASDADGYVHLWALGMPGLVEQACAVLGRNLSWKEWQRYMGESDYECTCPSLSPGPDVKQAARNKARGCGQISKPKPEAVR